LRRRLDGLRLCLDARWPSLEQLLELPGVWVVFSEVPGERLAIAERRIGILAPVDAIGLHRANGRDNQRLSQLLLEDGAKLAQLAWPEVAPLGIDGRGHGETRELHLVELPAHLLGLAARGVGELVDVVPNP